MHRPSRLSPLRIAPDTSGRGTGPIWRLILQDMLGGVETPDGDALADTTGLFWAHGGLSLTTLYFPATALRLASFGRDVPGILIFRAMDGPLLIQQANRQVAAARTDVLFVNATRPLCVTLPDGGRLDCALLPAHALNLSPMQLSQLSMRCIPGTCLPLQLLITYAGYLLQQRHQTDEQATMMVRHFCQLLPVLVAEVADETIRAFSLDRFASITAMIARRASDSAFGIVDVAEAEGVSARAIQKLFRKKGTTFSQHLLEHRLDTAREQLLLRDDAPSITQLAFDHGFEDPAYFSRAFRKRHGLSPRALKRSAAHST